MLLCVQGKRATLQFCERVYNFGVTIRTSVAVNQFVVLIKILHCAHFTWIDAAFRFSVCSTAFTPLTERTETHQHWKSIGTNCTITYKRKLILLQEYIMIVLNWAIVRAEKVTTFTYIIRISQHFVTLILECSFKTNCDDRFYSSCPV
jgi:hypothetical protein